MKALIFFASLLAITSCQDNADTPNILIGNWTLNVSNVTSSSPCCLPTGTLTIISTGSDTITLSASGWAGSECGSRNSSYSQVISGIDGSDSWNELTADSGEPAIYLSDATGDVIIAVVAFVEGQNIMDINVNENYACNALFVKPATSNSTTPVTPDPADTPNILIGNWHLNVTNTTSSSDCCLPAGTLTIANSGYDTITLSATSWAGSTCGSRNSTYSQIISGIDGSDSWNELTAASGEPAIYLSDATGDVIVAVVAFVDGQNIMDINVNENYACNAIFVKPANSTTPVIPDPADTPNILIGHWNLNVTNTTSSSDCCLPAGTLTITNTGSNTITLSATAWAGSTCGSRNSSYSQVISGIDGSDSWNELTAASGEPGIFLSDSQGDVIIAVVAFLDGQNIMDINDNENNACNAIFVKSAHLKTIVN